MEKGFLALILHAHLPFVRHPEHEFFLEENWLYEAITDTYIPLIEMMSGLERDRVPFRLTMTLTPTLISMLTDELLQDRYLRHLHRLIELGEKEIERTKHQNEFHELAYFYRDRFVRARTVFVDQYQKNLIRAFKGFQDRGHLEIITCGATHAFFPLQRTLSAVRAQVGTAVQHYERHFSRKPKGIWLPECGYFPDVEKVLKEFGINFFITETHGILFASPRPKYGVFAPILCPSGVAAFGRDMESSKQVWSASEGYPGDYDYREYYRDIGFDLPEEYMRPYMMPDGLRVNTGFKYYRITGNTNHKEPYRRAKALEKAAYHAGNFLFNREKQAEHLFNFMGRKPIITAPYDAELFGHWWFEGPEFLNFLIRKIAFDQKTIRLISPIDYFKEYSVNQVSTPSFSSWGNKGYAETWLSGANDWIYPHLHQATLRMEELAARYPSAQGLHKRALNQAARELFLAQSSDWAFIMTMKSMVPYAIKRTKEHLLRFNRIYDELLQGRPDEAWLSEIESKDSLFPEIEYQLFSH